MAKADIYYLRSMYKTSWKREKKSTNDAAAMRYARPETKEMMEQKAKRSEESQENRGL